MAQRRENVVLEEFPLKFRNSYANVLDNRISQDIEAHARVPVLAALLNNDRSVSNRQWGSVSVASKDSGQIRTHDEDECDDSLMCVSRTLLMRAFCVFEISTGEIAGQFVGQ